MVSRFLSPYHCCKKNLREGTCTSSMLQCKNQKSQNARKVLTEQFKPLKSHSYTPENGHCHTAFRHILKGERTETLFSSCLFLFLISTSYFCSFSSFLVAQLYGKQNFPSISCILLSKIDFSNLFPNCLILYIIYSLFSSVFFILYQIFLLFTASFQQLLILLFRAINSLQITFALLQLTLQDLVKPVLQGAHTFKLNEIYLNEV